MVEGRPRMLKDFLLYDSNSCPFNSFPWEPITSTKQTPTRKDSKLLQAVINAVKSIAFISVKPPSILPRSLSRKLSKKSNGVLQVNKVAAVKVKDIIRWTSFRDIVEEESGPLDCTTNTNTSGSTSGSSWCDTDFSATSEDFDDEYNVVKTFLPCVGEDHLEPTTIEKAVPHLGPEEDNRQRQHSLTSVIDFEFEEDEDFRLQFDHSFANVESRKHTLKEKTRRFEIMAKLEPTNLENLMSTNEIISSEKAAAEAQEKNDKCQEDHDGETNNEVEKEAWELLNHLREPSPLGRCKESINKLLMDFFREELNRDGGQLHFDMLMEEARAWVDGENDQWMGWEVEEKRVEYVKDMEKGGKWKVFEEDQEEIALVIGDVILGFLVDELLFDCLS